MQILQVTLRCQDLWAVPKLTGYLFVAFSFFIYKQGTLSTQPTLEGTFQINAIQNC